MSQPRRDLSNLTGKYGDWTIIRRAAHPNGMKRTHYLCRCKCGFERIIKAVNLVNGKTRSCGRSGCKKVTRSGVCVGALTASIWGSIKRNASIRNISLLLTQQEAWELFDTQGGLCALTGESLILGHGSRGTASLDRIDSTEPYKTGNVQWVLKEINIMKRALPQDRFIEICKTIAALH